MLILQLLANGLVTGCIYAMVALGFSLIYRTTRVFHFAHGAVYMVAGYAFFWGAAHVHWVLASVGAVVTVAVLGVLVDTFIHQPLDQRRATPLIHMLSSLGLYIILVNVVAIGFGSGSKLLEAGSRGTYAVGGLVLTRIQLVTLLLATLSVGGTALVLRRSSLGLWIRAMRDDPELVVASGIDPLRIRRLVFALGSALAGLAAVLVALDVGIDPHVGLAAILTAAVALVIGGDGTFAGAALGGLVLGIVQSLAVWQTSGRWQDAFTFLILICFLLFRPEGLLGTRRRVEEAAV